jgi:hypothetical protein
VLSADQIDALLHAVPSFAPTWQAWWADHLDYAARFPEAALTERETAIELLGQLAWRIGEQVARGDVREAPSLFAALERLYRGADEDLWNQLTIGFMESLIYTIEGNGGDAAVLTPLTAGPETGAAWRAAYEYTHRQATQSSGQAE